MLKFKLGCYTIPEGRQSKDRRGKRRGPLPYWKGERQPAHPRGVHQIDMVHMLAAKLELVMKKLESQHQEVNQVSESRMTCCNTLI